jgi:hypothetical protein
MSIYHVLLQITEEDIFNSHTLNDFILISFDILYINYHCLNNDKIKIEMMQGSFIKLITKFLWIYIRIKIFINLIFN